MDGLALVATVDGSTILDRVYWSGARAPLAACIVATTQQQLSSLSSGHRVIDRWEQFAVCRLLWGDVMALALTSREQSASMLLELMQKVLENIEVYFSNLSAATAAISSPLEQLQRTSLTARLLQEEYVTAGLLLDEMIDGGLPGVLDSNTLGMLVPPKSLVGTLSDLMASASSFLDPLAAAMANVAKVGNVGGSATVGGSPKEKLTATLAASVDVPGAGLTGGSGMGLGSGFSGCGSSLWWRRGDGPRCSHNDVLLDQIDVINCLVDKHGKVRHGAITGQIRAFVSLPGAPQCILFFKNASVLGPDPQLNFHPCVRPSTWTESETVGFVPPEGQFILLDYAAPARTPSGVCQPPLTLVSKVYFARSPLSVPQAHIEFVLSPNRRFNVAGAQSGDNSDIKVESLSFSVSLPFPVSEFTLKECTSGSARFITKQRLLHWKLAPMRLGEVAGARPRLVGVLSLALRSSTSSQAPKPAPPPGNEDVLSEDMRLMGHMRFVVPNLAVSGLHIDSVEVRGVEGAVKKLFRSSSMAGTVEFCL